MLTRPGEAEAEAAAVTGNEEGGWVSGERPQAMRQTTLHFGCAEFNALPNFPGINHGTFVAVKSPPTPIGWTSTVLISSTRDSGLCAIQDGRLTI